MAPALTGEAMTTNQTIDGVPRSLLQSLYTDTVQQWGVGGNAAGKLRALLDATAPIPVPAAWMRFDHDQKAIFTRGKRSNDSEPLYPHPTAYRMQAAQPQGKPVAYADPKAFENFGSLAHLGGLYAKEWMWANPAPGLIPLYAEQPAPVAVVLPDRFKAVMRYLLGEDDLDGHLFRDPHKDGMYWWRRELRACLDDLKRLNPSL